MSQAVSDHTTNPPPPAMSRIRHVLIEQGNRSLAPVLDPPAPRRLPLDFAVTSRPDRAELIEALQLARRLLYLHGSDLAIDGYERLPFLKLAHQIDRLIIRGDNRLSGRWRHE